MKFFRPDAPSGAALHVNKFGYCASVANGSWTPLVSSGVLNFLTSADVIRVKAGGNSNDTSAGSGAQTVIVEGLDGNWALASATLTTAGASASASSTTSFIRVFRAYVKECGTYGGTNAAAIVIETEGGTELCTIPAGESQTQHTAYTVPVGYSARIVRVSGEVPSSKDADLRMCIRLGADDVTTPFKPMRVVGFRKGVAATERAVTYVEGINLPPKTDVWIEAYGNGAGVSAGAEFELWLISPPVESLNY